MNVCVLYNAPSLPPEHPDYSQEASVLDAVDAVSRGLTAGGHAAVLVPAVPDPAALVAALRAARPDVVFNLCEGFGGGGNGEAQVAGLLELCGLAYTGCDSDCLALARNKPLAKLVLQGAGLPTPPFYRVAPGAPLPPELELAQTGRDDPWDAAWIVKPAHEDASLGIGPQSVVRSAAALERQVAAIHRNYGEALVERFVDGREFNVGILAMPRPQAMPLAEIEFGDLTHGVPIVTYDGKWALASNDSLATPARCPARVAPDLAAEIERVALAAFDALGGRDYARVDLRLGVDGAGRPTPYVLELNPNPDIGPFTGFAGMLQAAGIDYASFVCDTVRHASSRQAGSRPLPHR